MAKEFRAFVDRIEGDKAVLLVGDKQEATVIFPAAYLPDGVGEGAVLTIIVRYEPELTAEASEQVAGLIRRLSGEQ